jgi:hypothetical protein
MRAAAGAGEDQMRNKSKSVALKDEVYRQMFRLEESRPAAEVSLALALLRAWLSASSKAESGEERKWLKTISPICLSMIEAALPAGNTSRPCAQ